MSTIGAPTPLPGATTATEPGTTGSVQPMPARGSASSLAGGKVSAVRDGKVVFVPSQTNYEFELACPAYAGPVNKLVKGTIRVTARKVWTVPSGGNFVVPIFGPPRIIQGRVTAIEPGRLVVHAGVPVVVVLPEDDSAFEMAEGAIAVGVMVNVTALPGAAFESAK